MGRLYRKKPVVIEAARFFGGNFHEINKFVGKTYPDPDGSGELHWGFTPHEGNGDGVTAVVWDKLHDTWVGVKPGQWIIRGVQGEFYPCDAEVFTETYEEVDYLH